MHSDWSATATLLRGSGAATALVAAKPIVAPTALATAMARNDRRLLGVLSMEVPSSEWVRCTHGRLHRRPPHRAHTLRSAGATLRSRAEAQGRWQTDDVSATVRSARQLVGRDDVRRRIAVALAEAGGQGSRTVVIVGEAGIGKTWLARDAAEHVPDAIVFAGACLPLATISVPFLVLRTLLRNPEVASAAPIVDFDAPAAQVLVELDRWVDAATVRSRIVLLVDDLQWADPATLDVLLYLMSRPGDGRLSIIVTVRDGHVGASREVDRWLANVRRMPGLRHRAARPARQGRDDRSAHPASRSASASIPRRRRVAARPRIAVPHRARCRRRRSAGAATADPDAEGPRGHRA